VIHSWIKALREVGGIRLCHYLTDDVCCCNRSRTSRHERLVTVLLVSILSDVSILCCNSFRKCVLTIVEENERRWNNVAHFREREFMRNEREEPKKKIL
jgi:hypothetical protein